MQNALLDLGEATFDTFIYPLWKAFPFRSGNRIWLTVLLEAYIACLGACFVLACMLNAVEGDKWLQSKWHGHGVRANGITALDECFWFVITTMHGVAFSDFMVRGLTGRLIAMLCVSLGYWFLIFMLSIIMLSQLPGEKAPRLYDVASRMAAIVWPSYLLVVSFAVGLGATLGPSLSRDHDGKNQWATGVYYTWTLVHRMPFGDVFPDTPYARTASVPIAVLGMLYMPYVLALVAVRCPSIEQHQALLGHIRDRPEDALGRGYTIPSETGGNSSVREVVMSEYVQHSSS